MTWRFGGVLALGSAATLALGATVLASAHDITERVSVGPGGAQGNGFTVGGTISADGRFVAFASRADNLVPGDTNGVTDVFLRDRQTGTTRRVSLGPGGVQGDRDSVYPALSAHGRFVAFASLATNLVAGKSKDAYVLDAFVRDRRTFTTELVSAGRDNIQGDEGSALPVLSANGRFVAFASGASNLVPGDSNRHTDVFVRDRQTDTTVRVSVGPGGVQGDSESYSPAISANGRFVAFNSNATNLVPGDTNGVGDVFVRDRQTGTTRRVSLGRGGVQGDGGTDRPAISADGRFVAFNSWATNLVAGDTNGWADIFVRDLLTGTTRRVSLGQGGLQGDLDSYNPAISADGRFVTFESFATNLVPGDTNGTLDVFIRDRKMRTTRRVSVGPGGLQGDLGSFSPELSADGRLVAFESDATNLVPDDTNGVADIFVRILTP